MLEDGSILASGGNPQLTHTSRFNPSSSSWEASPFLNQQRWYSSNLILPSGKVLATFAKGANFEPEVFTPEGGWTNLPGASMADLFNEQNAVNGAAVNNSTTAQWYAYMHVAPDGRVFHPGPTETMHWFDTRGTGGVENAGQRLGGDRHRQFGISIMYDVGKLLVAGGNDIRLNPSSTATAMTIDINGAAPMVTPTASMQFARVFHDAVVLPTGDVLVIGGNTSGVLFSDSGTVLTPELWNPQTGQWRALANMTIPRNYHSVALLLQDGRVLSGGGGLCGNCATNHQDAEIFSPPYLFETNGSLATRPTIASAPSGALAGDLLTVEATGNIDRFSLIRLSSTTHSINTDQRYLPVDAISLGGGAFELAMPENPNVLIPGYYWLFAINAQGTPSVGHLLRVTDGANDGGWVFCANENQFCNFSGTRKVRYGANGVYTVDTFSDGAQCNNTTFDDPLIGVFKQCAYRLENAAQGKSASQSSTAFGGVATRAVDGNTDGVYNHKSVTHTHIESNAWWEVDLETLYNMDTITIRNRTDCCSNRLSDFYVLVSDAPFTSTSLSTTLNQPGVSAFFTAGTAAEETNIAVNRTGRYVRVQLNGTGILSLAEVQVFSTGTATVNTPPSVTSPGNQTSTEGDSVALTINATDPDSDPLTFSMIGQPNNLSINMSTGQISGSIATGTEGVYTITVAVSDGTDSDSVTFDWTVNSEGGGDPVPCLGLTATIVGTEGDDILNGTSGNDIIAGLGGNDVIKGRDGNDLICGGPGDDELTGARGDDQFDGGSGNDLITGGSGNDALDGGPGSDNCRGSSGDDSATNCEQLNSIENTGSSGAPMLANPGDQSHTEGDAISLTLSASDPDGDPLAFSASGLPADLTISDTTGVIAGTLAAGSAGTYSVTAIVSDGSEDDSVTFTWTVIGSTGGGDPTLCFGVVATLVGTEGNDTLVGTTGDDVIAGLGGNDLIRGRGGDDIICGNSGNDEILGQNGDDLIDGGSGMDLLKGGKGRDSLQGGPDNDDLRGNNDNDDLMGGAGEDTCNGNSGDDTVDSCETTRNIP